MVDALGREILRMRFMGIERQSIKNTFSIHTIKQQGKDTSQTKMLGLRNVLDIEQSHKDFPSLSCNRRESIIGNI